MEDYTRVTIDSYDATAVEYADKVKGLLPQSDFERFTSYLLPGAEVLDLGCGSGVAANAFFQSGFKILGVDLSKKLLEIARNNNPGTRARFEVMDVTDLTFPDESFDAAWNCACLLHVAKNDVECAINGIHRILKPGGVFYHSTKKGKEDSVLPDERYGGVLKQQTRWTEEETRKILQDSGFIIMYEGNTVTADNYNPNVPWMSFFCRK